METIKNEQQYPLKTNMKKEAVIQALRALKWERWLERPFQAFTLSLTEHSLTAESFKKIGVEGVELKAMLFQEGTWFISKEVFDAADSSIEKYLDTHSMKDVTKSLAEFKKKSEKKIKDIIKSKKTPEEKFKDVFEILTLCFTYVWLAHGIESYYGKKLKEEVPKYVKGDIEKFIGDASLPKKKPANDMLNELMRGKTSSKEIAEKLGWVKVRDGFSEPFSADEIENMRKDMKPVNAHAKVVIPKQLKKLFEEIQELVFFRTERTDVLYYLYFISRPILKEMAAKHGIDFKEMRYYRAESFIAGKPEKYNPMCSLGYIDGKVIFQNEPIIAQESLSGKEKIKGTIAFAGKVQGTVKIVKDVSQLGKVGSGDILVTQMTFPNFIPAMNKALAFVTDEGGITCHAAIVAREMRKPCITGTKNATKVLHDGDLIEVDANKGEVKIIKKAGVKNE